MRSGLLRACFALALGLLIAAAVAMVPPRAGAETEGNLTIRGDAPANAGRVLAGTWSGSWSSEWGTMTLTQTGSRLEGSYPHDQGHIVGTISGNIFTGRWDEAPTRQGPSDAGAVIFTLSADGKSFTGRWNYDGSQAWRTNWSGRCTGGPCASAAPPPVKTLPPPPPPPAAEVKAAVAWTQTQLGASKWAGRCQRFVEASYGATTGYKSAAEAASKIGLRSGPIAEVPRGALIYFRANCPGVTGKAGHVGISLGKGEMISALGRVKITDLTTSKGWKSAYSGWTYPPAKWPGRKP